MAVEILLMQDVAGLGAEGAVVKVADGYARNYLIPRKIGAPVTQATRRKLVKLQGQRAEERTKVEEASRQMAEALTKESYTLRVKVGEGEKLYGSVTTADIAEVLKGHGFEVDKHNILLADPIRELGAFDVKIKLQPEVETTIKVWIVEE